LKAITESYRTRLYIAAHPRGQEVRFGYSRLTPARAALGNTARQDEARGNEYAVEATEAQDQGTALYGQLR